MTKHGKVAVIGDADCVLAFRAIGVKSFGAANESEAKDILRELIRDNYAVVFVTDDIAAKIPDTLEILKTRTFPAVIPIPSPTGGGSYGMLSIRKDVERALGADILFKDGE